MLNTRFSSLLPGLPTSKLHPALCSLCGQARPAHKRRHEQLCLGQFINSLSDEDRRLLPIPDNWHEIIKGVVINKKAASKKTIPVATNLEEQAATGQVNDQSCLSVADDATITIDVDASTAPTTTEANRYLTEADKQVYQEALDTMRLKADHIETSWKAGYHAGEKRTASSTLELMNAAFEASASEFGKATGFLKR